MARREPAAASSICPECGHGDGEHEFLCERGVEEIRERAYGSAATTCPRCGAETTEAELTYSGCATCQEEAAENAKQDVADEARSAASARPVGQWPAWVSDILAFAPVAELEAEWRAEIGDAITAALDLRNGSRVIKCACCGATRAVPK